MSTPRNEIFNPVVPGLPSKGAVVRLCRKRGRESSTVTYSTRGNTFSIKDRHTSMEEAHAQVFFHREIQKRTNSPIRIPEVYRAFQEDGITYIVMEHINIDFERTASDEQRAQAISELISIPPPPGVFGSLSGGPWRHYFFRDAEPPVLFSSAAEIEGYLNRCLAWFNTVTKRQDRVDFSSEPLLCYYANIHPSNFPVDKHGQLWVVDFDQAGVLPSSFMDYAIVAYPRNRLPIPIRKTIPLPETSNLGALLRVGYVTRNITNDWHIPPKVSTEADTESPSTS